MGNDREHLGPERRHPGQAEQSPAEKLRQMPAYVLLERLPDPALAIAHDGTILFANTAFGDMLGHPAQALADMHICQIIPKLNGDSAFPAVQAAANTIVELTHRDDFPVRAVMSVSAMLRRDDALALITFNDRTELIWGGLRQK